MAERNHQLPPEMPTTDPLQEIAALKHVVDELMIKIQVLVSVLDEAGLLEDHAFTFPDGDHWKAQDIKP